MHAAVYILNTLTFSTCAVLLLRAYAGVKQRLLLWSGLCFLILGLANLLTFVDLILLPTTVSLYTLRLLAAAIATSLLLFGLIWESEGVQ